MYKLIKKDQNIPKYNAEVSSLNNKYKPQYLYMTYLGLFDLNNFELNNEEKRIVENYKEIQNSIPQNDLEIYKLFREKPLESILLYASSVDFNIANRYLDVLQNVQIETSGNDLKNIGIEPSKIYKEIFEFVEKFRKTDATTPIVVVPTSFNSVTEEEFKSRGVNVVIYANQLTRAAFPAMQNVAEMILKNHRALECDDLCMQFEEIITLIPEDF